MYVANSPVVQPFDFTTVGEGAAVPDPAPQRETTEALYTRNQIVCDSSNSHSLFI